MTISNALPGDPIIKTSVIPAKPKRIVSVDPGQMTDITLALGAPLVAAAQIHGSWDPSFADHIPPTVTALSFPITNMEQIAALKPDLIIGLEGQFGANYAKLAAIAPVVAIPYAPYTPGASPEWRWYLEHVAAVEGDSHQVLAILGQLEAAAAPLRATLAGWSGAIMEVYPALPKFLLCYGETGELLTDLGATINSKARLDNCDQIGPENLGSITDPNIIVLHNNPGDADLAALRSQPLWSTLPAVKAGHVFLVPEYWAEAGPSAYLKTLQDIPRVLTDLAH